MSIEEPGDESRGSIYGGCVLVSFCSIFRSLPLFLLTQVTICHILTLVHICFHTHPLCFYLCYVAALYIIGPTICKHICINIYAIVLNKVRKKEKYWCYSFFYYVKTFIEPVCVCVCVCAHMYTYTYLNCCFVSFAFNLKNSLCIFFKIGWSASNRFFQFLYFCVFWES